MSKLAVIRQYQTSPAAGGIFGSIIGAVGKFIGKGLGIIKPAAAKVAQAAATPTGKAVLTAATAGGAAALLSGTKSSGGASGYYGPRRRSRGITARELRGYRKVANLIHKEGMVSKRARGRH